MTQQPTLIYIGASLLQLPAINWAKQQGLKVVVTDTNPKAPGVAMADDYRQLNGADVAGLMQLAQEISAQDKLVGCYCGSDFGLAAVAAIAASFDLPAASEAATALALDKPRAKALMQAAGVNVPRGECITCLSELQTAVTDLGLPVIIKPVDSSGSRGVRTVSHLEQLPVALMEAQKFSTEVLVEQVVVGEHIDVNGLFAAGQFYPCGLLDRYFSPRPFNYPLWGCQPSALSEVISAKVYASVEAGARALGIDAGPIKADVIVCNQEPVILEIAPRFHGDVSSSFVTPLATNGHSASQAWFAYLAGQSFEAFLPRENDKQVAGWMAVFPDSAGEFVAIDGIDEASAVVGVKQISTLKKPGYRVDSVADNLAVMGFIWAAAENRVALKQCLDLARQRLQVRMQM